MQKTIKLICFWTLLLIFGSTICVSAAVIIGKGKTDAYSIDYDGDGYGVGPTVLGPDCDDNDSSIHKPATYEEAKKYIPQTGNLYFISPNGNDDTGEVNNINRPYATFTKIRNILKPGDVVIFREGTYQIDYTIGISDFNASKEKPLTIMAYPGEKVILDRNGGYSCIGCQRSSYIIFDGLILQNAQSGGDFACISNIEFKNIESRNNVARGLIIMQDSHNITITHSVFHDNIDTHGIYIGARDLPNSNITVKDCLMYKNGRHGFQDNGRCDNLYMANNIIHSNELGGISLIDGVTNSVFENNLIFNNNQQGIILYIYEYPGGIFPYNNTNNLFINNTIWMGVYNNGRGSAIPTNIPGAIVLTDNIGTFTMVGNVFRNNIIVKSGEPAIWFSQFRHINGTTFENNLIFQSDGQSYIMGSYEGDGSETYANSHPLYYWNLQDFEKRGANFRNNRTGNPLFKDVNNNYYNEPEQYDFRLASNSPAIDLGFPSNAPTTDMIGTPRSGLPDAGCYEYRGEVISPKILEILIH